MVLEGGRQRIQEVEQRDKLRGLGLAEVMLPSALYIQVLEAALDSIMCGDTFTRKGPGLNVLLYANLSHEMLALSKKITILLRQNSFHWDGLQLISWIETDSGDIRGKGARGMDFGYMESLKGPFWPRNRIKNDKRSDGRKAIEESGRTIF